jgi:dipeptidyl aminopeptidase/acylaminoacyl peptidase
MEPSIVFSRIFASIVLVATLPLAQAEVTRATANNGQLLMEDVPPIPQDIVRDLNRYQNVRSAGFRAWTLDSSGIYVSTRFGDVDQIHHVGHPGGARTQLTFFSEPTGGVSRQPGNSAMAFTMDAGGSEFSQIFLMDPATGAEPRMLSDGESQNGSLVWSRDGSHLAFRSTRRNGSSNDVWVMDVNKPDSARMVMESPDGSYWMPADFSVDGKQMLILNYVGNADSRIHLLDLESGEMRLLAGGPDNPGANFPAGFDTQNEGFWYTTDRAGEFQQLAWQSLTEGSKPNYVTADIPWHVETAVFSKDRRRGAFAVNENGFSRLYLLDATRRKYRAVENLPVGVVGSLKFSPDSTRLGMTLNTPQTPSDSFILNLRLNPLQHDELTRWTFSEVGGLDTAGFIEPELISYPTFDSGKGGPDSIPAWLYQPPGPGPHPVVISIHGGPEGQARPWFSSTYQMWLKKLGVAVLVPNVRGSDGYGKHYMGLDNGFKREDSVRDIGALLDWIASEPALDENRVAVFGGSYGGYMVLASSMLYSDRLKAAVDIVGISNFVTFLENTQDYRRDARRAEYGDERDPKMRAHLEAISPLNQVEKIRVPMFVVQGQNDPRVPVTEAEQIVNALRQQGQPVWYMNALNEGHGYRKKENRDIYQQATILFFKHHLLDEKK